MLVILISIFIWEQAILGLGVIKIYGHYDDDDLDLTKDFHNLLQRNESYESIVPINR